MRICTTFSRLSRSAAATLAVLATAAGVTTALPAAPASAAPLSTHVFSYADMPDIDQERLTGTDGLGVGHAGLPNGGKMYCGPTSAMDALAFLADHGASGMAPGSHAWTAAGNYETMTADLNSMGSRMSIDPKKGVSQSGFESGLTSWNSSFGTNATHFGFVSEFPNDETGWEAPNLGIATLAEAFGNPVIVRIGYYTPKTVKIGGQTINIMERTGGHFIAMTGYENGALNFMDPDDVGGSFAQSAYANQVQPVNQVSATFANSADQPYRVQNDNGTISYPTETYWHMPGYSQSAYIEGYTVIQPSFTLTAKKSYLQLVRGLATLKYKLAVAGTVADAQLSPAGDAAYYSMTNGKTVYKLNLSTGVSAPLTRANAPVTSLAVDTTGDRVFAAAGHTVAAVSNTGAKVATTTLPSAVAGLAFDPVRGQVDAVTPKSKSVTVLGTTLAPQGSVSLPAASVKNATAVAATVDPATGKLTIKAPGIATTTVSAPLPAPTPVAPVIAQLPIATTTTTTATTTTTPVVTPPAATTTVSAATIASIVNQPVVHVTPAPKTTVSAKSALGAITHSAVLAPAAAAIVRSSQTLGTTGVQAQQYEG